MSFYSSNNKKFKAYATSRRKEEEYYDDQQDQLDEMLAEKRGEVAMVDRYARLAKQVVNSFGQQVLQPSKQLAQSGTPAATDYLRDLIKTGSLSQWFDKIKNMDTKGLSKAAKIIVKDIKDPNTRSQIVQSFNDTLSSFGGEEMEKFFQRQSVSRMGQAANTTSSLSDERKRALTASLDVLNNIKSAQADSTVGGDFIDIAYKAFIDNVAGGNEEALKEIAQKLSIVVDNTSGKQRTNTPNILSPAGKDPREKRFNSIDTSAPSKDKDKVIVSPSGTIRSDAPTINSSTQQGDSPRRVPLSFWNNASLFQLKLLLPKELHSTVKGDSRSDWWEALKKNDQVI